MDEWGYFGTHGKKETNKKNDRDKYETLHKEKCDQAKKSGSMTRVEISNYATEVLSTQFTGTSKKSLERKPTHPQDILNKKR